jgi:outer membrane protein W
MKRAVFVTTLLLTVAVPVFAETPGYVALKIGSYSPQASDMDRFKDASCAELEGGYYFNENFAIELGIGVTISESKASATTASGASAKGGLWITPITLGVRGSIPLGGFEPFATAGIGAYYAKIKAGASLPGGEAVTGSQTDIVLGYFLGLGANYNFTRTVYLGLEGKYFWAQPTFNVQGVDVKINIDGIYLTANVGYRF